MGTDLFFREAQNDQPTQPTKNKSVPNSFPKRRLVVFCLLCMLVGQTGCLAPPMATVVDPSQYDDNPIDKALGTRRNIPFADAIAANLQERFPLGSNLNDFTVYLLNIGSQCNSISESASAAVHCIYEKRRSFTRHKIEGFFFARKGELIGKGSFVDHVEITLGSSDGVLKSLFVDYHVHAIGVGQFP